MMSRIGDKFRDIFSNSRTRLIAVSAISVSLVLFLLIGSTYSIFVSSSVDENLNVYKTGVLDVEYILEDEELILENSRPVSEKDIYKVKAYRITVNNKGNVPYKFNLILEDTTATNVIDYKYIMTKVGTLESKRLSECTDNVIKEGVIVPANDSAIMDVRIYISSDLANSEIGKVFAAKLLIDGIAVYHGEEVDNSDLMAPGVLKVSYDANGGVGTIESINSDPSTAVVLPTGTEFTKEGYTISGWALNSVAGEKYNLSDSVNLKNDSVFYAVWEANTSHNLWTVEEMVNLREGKDNEVSKNIDLTGFRTINITITTQRDLASASIPIGYVYIDDDLIYTYMYISNQDYQGTEVYTIPDTYKDGKNHTITIKGVGSTLDFVNFSIDLIK